MPGPVPADSTTETLIIVDDARPRDTGAPPIATGARLVSLVGDEAGRTFPLRGGLTVIGRGSEADISLSGTEVSRRHAAIERRRDGYVITDLGSRNGTTVNRVPIGEKVLARGDHIQFGSGAILAFALEDELEIRAERMAKLEGLAAVTGGIVHDFKNTLAVIVSNADLLERELDAFAAKGDARAMVDDIRTAARAGLESARRLLYFAGRDRAGSAGWQDVEVSALIERLLAVVRRLLATDHIRLDTYVEPGLLLRGNADELYNALLNLVGNARDAMTSGGQLTIAVDACSFGRAEAMQLHLPFAGAYVEITVADSGCGMDATTQARMFEPFFTTKPPGEGTGLGLSSVYGIVRNHGGNVLVDSAPGAGTRVRVLLPAR